MMSRSVADLSYDRVARKVNGSDGPRLFATRNGKNRRQTSIGDYAFHKTHHDTVPSEQHLLKYFGRYCSPDVPSNIIEDLAGGLSGNHPRHQPWNPDELARRLGPRQTLSPSIASYAVKEYGYFDLENGNCKTSLPGDHSKCGEANVGHEKKTTITTVQKDVGDDKFTKHDPTWQLATTATARKQDRHGSAAGVFIPFGQ